MQVEQIIELLTAERDRLQRAIDALSGSESAKKPARRTVAKNSPASGPAKPPAKRKLSAAGRKAIIDASKRRWAAINAAKASSLPSAAKGKRTLSAGARKAMADAAKRRWAAIKAGKAQNPFAKGARKKAA